MGVPRAAHEVVPVANQREHVVDREDRPDLVGGEDQDDVALRGGDASADRVDDAAPERVVDDADVLVVLPHPLDDRDAVVVRAVADDEHLVRYVDGGPQDLSA